MAKAETKKPKAPAPAGAYQWKPGARFRVKAAVAGAELDRIRRRSGELTPAAVVEAAADPQNPLHGEFDWDDSEAARKYRESQARALINSVRVVVKLGDPAATQQVAFVSVCVRDSGRAYLPTNVVMADTDYSAQALAEALTALEGWQRRYAHLQDLTGVFAAINAAKPKVPPPRRAA